LKSVFQGDPRREKTGSLGPVHEEKRLRSKRNVAVVYDD